MRYDRDAGVLSLYDVYHFVKPEVNVKNIGHNLRDAKLKDRSPKFAEFLSSKFLFLRSSISSPPY